MLTIYCPLNLKAKYTQVTTTLIMMVNYSPFNHQAMTQTF